MGGQRRIRLENDHLIVANPPRLGLWASRRQTEVGEAVTVELLADDLVGWRLSALS